ncbi:Hypothetical protein, putative [Bodo saltans]|uniref:Cullin family profile domain-containing protein n=1 Tax=Bodo saltans TaxID=75058 RepID=A0A0S4IUY9_BODSA|nr:Hypothetical protein, putative [Bodo saltans]|eukprot:CUF96575.1 Hypothetical protein, putative [Bodo saltans]
MAALVAPAAQPRGRMQLPPLTDIHEQIRDARNHIRAALDNMLVDRSLSTIAKRMERCMLVQSFYDACAVLSHHAMFQTAEPRDPNEELDTLFTTSIRELFNKLQVGDSHETLSAQYRQLRRAISDCKSMLQPLTTFHGKDYIENTVLHIAAKALMTIPNFGSQQMMAMGGFGALPQLRELHSAKTTNEKAFHELRDQIRDCFRFPLELTFGNERPRFIGSLRELYTNAVVAQHDKMPVTDVNEYLKLVSDILDREVMIVAEVLPHDTEAPEVVKLHLQRKLLSAEANETIIKDEKNGVVSTLQYPNLDASKFRILLNVLDFDKDAVQFIKQEFEVCVTKVTTAELQPNSSKPTSALSIAAMYSTFSAFIRDSTQAHHRQLFLRVLDKSLASIFDAATMAVVVADELDGFIRKAPKQNLPQAEITKSVDGLAALVAAACEVDLYIALHRQRLAQRLLTARRPMVPLEEFVLKRLAIRLTVDEVAPLFHMLREAVNVRPLVGVSLCNSLMWPVAVRHYDGGRLPAPLSSSVDTLVRQMDLVGRHPELQAQTDYWLSTGIISLSVGEFKCSVYGILPQLAVLTHLFADVDGAHKVDSIAASVGLDPVACFDVLLSMTGSGLVRSEHKLFASEPKGVELNNGKKISLHAIAADGQFTTGSTGLPGVPTPKITPHEPPVAKAVPQVRAVVDKHLKKKEEANALFKQGKYVEAIRLYNECLKITSSINAQHDAEVANLNDTIYSNIILANLKLRRYAEVITDANDFFMTKPTPSADLRRKVATRRGQARFELGDYANAVEDFKMAKMFIVPPVIDPMLDEWIEKCTARLANRK